MNNATHIMKAKYVFPKQRQQQGVVLAIALIMLVLITLLAVSGMRSTIMEERMVSNSRNSNTAFQLAESALRQAELALQAAAIANLASVGPLNVYDAEINNNVPGVTCMVTLNSLNFNLPATWPGISCDLTGSTIAELNTRQLPHYFIEFVFAEPTLMVGAGGVPVRDCYYRITSRGYGADENSFVTLQTTYKFDICT